jgi:molybdopterin molybdotransferase
MLSVAEARARILERAEPGDSIEIPLSEALGLVLAEPAVADVDMPPFDRAGFDGYALRAADVGEGAHLRVVGLKAEGEGDVGFEVGPDEAARVRAGDPLPVGADAVVRTEDTRPDPGHGPPRVVAILRVVEPGQNVLRRGFYLRAGAVLAAAGTRIRLPMIGLLAAQGCIHPVCHRRVRVAVLAVGDHLVGPGEAPVMHRERNAAGPTIVAPCVHWGASAHDLGTVPERDLDSALSRGLNAPVVVVLGPTEGAIPNALARAGVEPVVEGVALTPGKRMTYGVVFDGSGRVRHHVFQLPPNPVGALAVVTLLIGPLLARLQGDPSRPPAWPRAVWTGAFRPTDDRLWAVPVTVRPGDDGCLRAVPVPYRGKDDVLGFAQADALALLPARSGPWQGGEVVEFAPLGPGAMGPG